MNQSKLSTPWKERKKSKEAWFFKSHLSIKNEFFPGCETFIMDGYKSTISDGFIPSDILFAVNLHFGDDGSENFMKKENLYLYFTFIKNVGKLALT